MEIYNTRLTKGVTNANLLTQVERTKLEPEIAAWLPTGPILGAHLPIHVPRREHDAFIDKVKPPIGRVEDRMEPSRCEFTIRLIQARQRAPQ